MTDVQIVRVSSSQKIEGDKRQYAPFEIRWRCPECGKACVQDCRSEYFSYPVFGEPEDLTLYCHECENEDVKIKVKLDLTLEIVN